MFLRAQAGHGLAKENVLHILGDIEMFYLAPKMNGVCTRIEGFDRGHAALAFTQRFKKLISF